MSNKHVLVTGGNGHLGNTLAKSLCERGYSVRATVRNPSEVKRSGIFDGYPIELHEADIRDEAALEKAMDGVAGVFQVAALYNYDAQGAGGDIVANNTEGGLAVLRCAKACGAGRVVFTSSIAAVGFGGTEERPLTEECWSDPEDPYCRSKLESEKAAWEYANEQGLDMIVLCPSVVLGPGFYKHTPSTINVSGYINNQIPFRVPFRASVVDVRDVAQAHIQVFESRRASGRYLVSGIHVSDLIGMLSEFDPEMALPERVLSIEETRQLAEKTGAPIEMVGKPFLYSDLRIRSELEWKSRPIEETLKDTIKWIKDRAM